MAKRLSEKIAMQMKADARKVSGHSRAIFLSLRDEIEEAVSDGWTLKAIWATLYKEGIVEFKYGMFRRYAQQILKKSGVSPNGKILKETSAIKNDEHSTAWRKKKEKAAKLNSPRVENFEYNLSSENVKDLI
ncbi:hypothetical protein AXE65_12445 [Ventosimonas gracilis]|uniref:Conjugal transfer protein TraK n=1 Tax=Ventosimonas gracilis TaxID=1680762 RepID=A0A139SW97_9GAMM|nr:TraK family protein [Ventosimonas gracilis]KXU38681.1 hypothetical protein AXE65_12445 [Ventosimonas gracilis]